MREKRVGKILGPQVCSERRRWELVRIRGANFKVGFLLAFPSPFQRIRPSPHWCLERVNWIKGFRGQRFYLLPDLNLFKHMYFLGPVVVYLFPVAWDWAEKYEGAWDSELTPGTERACSVSTVSQVAILDAPLTRVTWYRTIPSSMCGFSKVGWICRPQLPTMPSMPLVQVRFKASWVRSTTCKQGLDPDSFWTYESSTTLNLGFRGRKKTLFFFFNLIC